MSATRPLIALFTALTLLFGLPAAGAEAKAPASKSAAKKHKAAKKKRGKKRKARKRRKPVQPAPSAGAAQPGAIGTVTDVDGNLVTVTLVRGGSVTAQVTEDTDGACPSGPEEELEDEDVDDEDADEEEGDEPETDEPDDEDLRSARTCAATVGAPVYQLVVDEGVYGLLDLTD